MNESTSTPASPTDDLGFTYAAHRDGRVDLFHHGRLAVRLRGRTARDFIAEVEAGGNSEGQQLMARLTGNYKRGNERTAKDHPRNRR